ncbi:MAG: hypothetical protein E6Q06_03470 [Candidatus Moraniibacteriota bacterium]|nr:MAG: hypothetical protein E6Q06_03470 [Candidatus Moranbacteria bacterium]
MQDPIIEDEVPEKTGEEKVQPKSGNEDSPIRVAGQVYRPFDQYPMKHEKRELEPWEGRFRD